MIRRPYAFTLIEVLVVIGILVILAGLSVYGYRSISTSARSDATRLVLQNAEGAFAEWRRGAGVNQMPLSEPYPAAIMPAGLLSDKDQPSDARFTKFFRLTRGMFFRMRQNPSVRSMLDKMPTDRQFSITNYSAGALYSPTMVDFTQPDQALGLECFVTVGTVNYYYVCYSSHTAAADTEPRAGSQSATMWMETNLNTPILLDAWGNPIAMIPACGFVDAGNVLHTSAGEFPLPGPDARWTVGTGYAVNNVAAYPGPNRVWRLYRCTAAHVAAVGNAPGSAGAPWVDVGSQPFFMSAGPDEDLSTTQDNLYSYER